MGARTNRVLFTLMSLSALAACSGARSQAAEAQAAPVAPSAGSVASDAGAGATRPSGPAAEDGAAKDSKVVARTLAKVSELRGLSASRVVPGVTLERDQLVGKVKEKALREYPAEAIRREGQVLQLIGFAPVGFDYLGEMMKLLGAQLEGFYEPKNGTMYLAADLHGAEAQATLAHELVHALQDQHYDLRSRSEYRPGHGDETMALAALAEGDATSAMMDFAMKPQGRTALDVPEGTLRELMKGAMNLGDTQSVPHILRTTLVAPYVEGLAFVHALRKRGGWAMVDRAWQRPPVTTEQVLHVDKWDAAEPPLAVAVPSGKALGEGWAKVDEDTFGELDLSLVFGEWMDADDARAAASAWGGDRSAVWAKGDALALAAHVRYDAAEAAAGKPVAPAEADREARRAMSKLGPALKKKLGKAAIDDASTVCFERPGTGPLLASRKGRDVVIVAGPARAASSGWSSVSTCKVAKAWADEVLAQP